MTAPGVTATAAARPGAPRRDLAGALWRSDWAGLLAVVLLGGVLLAWREPAFLGDFNLYVLLISFSLWSVIGLSQMVTMAIGQMNLSVGAIGGMVAVVFGGLMEVWGVPAPAAALAGLALGLAAGALNGALTVFTGINSFIITLAMLSAYKGINLGITEAQPFYGIPEAVKALGNARLGALPHLLIVPLLVAGGLWLLMNRTVLGRHMLAIGGNAHAAALSGVSQARAVIAAHVLSGGLAAAAGMLAVARLQIAQPSIGEDWLILSFAAPILGGAVLTGGHVSVAGTLLGVLLISMINNALVLLRIDPFWVQLFLGLLILAAVGLNRLRELRGGGPGQ